MTVLGLNGGGKGISRTDSGWRAEKSTTWLSVFAVNRRERKARVKVVCAHTEATALLSDSHAQSPVTRDGETLFLWMRAARKLDEGVSLDPEMRDGENGTRQLFKHACRVHRC